jgi:hypothetical protein
MTAAWVRAFIALGLAGLLVAGTLGHGPPPGGPARSAGPSDRLHVASTGPNGTALGNFSASLNRLVALLGAAGGAILALAWARVALSWFSNDVAKKVQAKDRARDALIGTLIFVAALSGLVWGLAQWVLTGT